MDVPPAEAWHSCACVVPSIKPILPRRELHTDIGLIRRNNPEIFPESVSAYIDPFLGRGSMYFHMASQERQTSSGSRMPL